MPNRPNDGKTGTYACLYFTYRTVKRLQAWGLKNKIKNFYSGEGDDQFHITTTYTFLPITYVAAGILPPLPVKAKNFEIFGKNKEYLVLEVNSPFANNRRDYGMLLGAKSNFPDYKPHVSLAKDSGLTSVEGLSPIDFPLYLGREEVSAIDPNR